MAIVKNPKHGSPQDRGSADAYYGRGYCPHYWPSGTGVGMQVFEHEMTEQQIAEYKYGYANEDNRKDWG
jgi:hypothetical protein